MTFDLAARLPRQPRAGSTRRPELPDALRGFALLVVPMLSLFNSSALEFAASSAVQLSLLFGMSFAIRSDRPGSKPTAVRLLARRMLLESVAYRHLWVRLLKVSLAFSFATAALLHQAALLAPLLLVFGMAAFVLLFQQPLWRQRLRKLAPMGRMALANWLAQALVATALFYALEPRFGLLLGVAMPFAAFPVLQAVFSCRWLARPRTATVEPAFEGRLGGQAG
ncbi:DUF418 domain-containing protein [Variovorax sp. W6]|uniref:DUF418 domain-containing protein n=1 Tax=Variovorax sp. W6 TaxID=3093895 RepID=UPI003D80389B